jgi:signal transduction histidine kinase
MMSFRQQLWRWLVALLTAIGLLAGASAFWTTLQESEELLDRQLFEIAFNIAAATEATGSLPAPGSTGRLPADAQRFLEDDDDDEEEADDTQETLAVQVWGSATAALYATPAGIDIPRQTSQGFADTSGGGLAWRTFAFVAADRTVQVSQQAIVRRDFAEEAAINAVIPIAALIPLSWLVLWLVLRRVTRRLEALVTEIAQRDTTSDTPISGDDMPAELVPLVGAVNDLVDRLQRALAAQKRFVSDAAHQLRTPLAAVKLQLANLHHTAADDAETARLDALASGVDRAVSLTDQLLKLARYEAGDTPPRRERLDAATLLRDCIADILPLADHRHLDIGLDAGSGDGRSPVYIDGDAADLRILIGNLLDNAVRYTPDGGVVDVGLACAGPGPQDRVTVEVRDSGPGIAEADMAHVFDRFYRSPDAAGAGSGLGLSIAARIARLYGADLELENRRGANGEVAGLTARLSFAAAA